MKKAKMKKAKMKTWVKVLIATLIIIVLTPGISHWYNVNVRGYDAYGGEYSLFMFPSLGYFLYKEVKEIWK